MGNATHVGEWALDDYLADPMNVLRIEDFEVIKELGKGSFGSGMMCVCALCEVSTIICNVIGRRALILKLQDVQCSLKSTCDSVKLSFVKYLRAIFSAIGIPFLNVSAPLNLRPVKLVFSDTNVSFFLRFLSICRLFQ